MSRGTFLVRSVHGGDITVVDAHSDRSFARHAHDTFGIGLITEGAQRSWSGRGAVEAACGQLITVNPGEVHDGKPVGPARSWRSEGHTSELQSLMRISYAVFCLKKKKE